MPLRTLPNLRTRAALVVALFALALPATALAAEAVAPPAGSGWVGQEGAGGGAGGGSSEAQQGSSLGSGGGSTPAPEPEPQPVESSPPPAPEPIVSEVSPEAVAPTPRVEEPSAAVAEAPVAPVAEKPDPRSELMGGTAPVGTAVLGASAASASDAASPLPLAVSPDFSESSDSGGLNLYSPGVSLAIVFGFVLAGLAGRFALRRWRRRQRFNREAAEWQAAVRQLEPPPAAPLRRRPAAGSPSQSPDRPAA